eukprot:GHVH01015373.1.p1 GENE.GHVH01015373.1~~GHVH01015373.1.p1  ORF type:complete len:768 (-),score=68.09 GHVH01015373.1:2818-5121(-)
MPILRLEILSQVNSRWLPVMDTFGILCESKLRNHPGVLPYQASCESTSIGGIARVVSKQKELLQAHPDVTVARISMGGEFLGTPLFHVNDSVENSELYGHAMLAYKDWSLQGVGDKPFGHETDKFHSIFVPGKYEFDGGTATLDAYFKAQHDIGTDILCTNCDFDDVCGINEPMMEYKIVHVVDGTGNIEYIGILGLTIQDLHGQSFFPDDCKMTTWYDVLAVLVELAETCDSVIILSSMGLDVDILFAQFLNGIGFEFVNKISAIISGYDQNIPCQFPSGDASNPPYVNNNKLILDSDGIYTLSCATDCALYDQVDVSGCQPSSDNQKSLFNVPTRQYNIDIYPTGMHGYWLNEFIINDDHSIEFNVHPLVGNDVELDLDTLNQQYRSVRFVEEMSPATVGYTDRDLENSYCHTVGSRYGCSLGNIYAHAILATAFKPEFGSMAHITTQNLPTAAFVTSRMIANDISLGSFEVLDVQMAFPNVDVTTVSYKVTGQNLINNVFHGIYAVTGLQMASLRIVLHADFDHDRFLEDHNISPTSLNREIVSVWCPSGGDPQGVGDIQLGNRGISFFLSEEENRRVENYRKRRVHGKLSAVDGITGCSVIKRENRQDPVLEINTCLAQRYRDVYLNTQAQNSNYPPLYQDDCHCWQEVDPTMTYWITTSEFLLLQGDGYCFEAIDDIFRADPAGFIDMNESPFLMDYICNIQNRWTSFYEYYTVRKAMADADDDSSIYAFKFIGMLQLLATLFLYIIIFTKRTTSLPRTFVE